VCKHHKQAVKRKREKERNERDYTCPVRPNKSSVPSAAVPKNRADEIVEFMRLLGGAIKKLGLLM
jgi:hypothetical protein